MAVEIVEVPVEATYDLRRRVLRDHRPDLPVANAEDDRPGAFHLAAVEDGVPIGVASFSPQGCPDRPGAAALRLRGMAVEPARRGSGVGARLVAAGLERARAEGVDLVWANARDVALAFYLRLGFVTVGESFVEIDIPHTRVLLPLSVESCADG